MNVSLKNSLYIRPKNSSKERGTSHRESGTFLDSTFLESETNGQSSVVKNGNHHGTLKMGYLYSGINPGSGQELHMKYDESSTEDDPVMLVEGKDSQGKEFTKKIHLNDVDAEHATLAEMTALRVHLAQQGDKTVKASSGIPLMALGGRQDVNVKMDFRRYYEDWITNLKHAGMHQNADLYMSELERYLFYQRTTLIPGETFADRVSTASGAVQTDLYTKSTSSVEAESNPGLKDEDYEYLSGKWNPTQMSQDDYDEFLDYLHNKGIVSEEDKKYVGYGGDVCADFEWTSYYTPHENPVIDFKDGNLLAFTRCQSSYIIFDSNGMESETGKHVVNLYKTIMGILEEMQIRRENK